MDFDSFQNAGGLMIASDDSDQCLTILPGLKDLKFGQSSCTTTCTKLVARVWGTTPSRGSIL